MMQKKKRRKRIRSQLKPILKIPLYMLSFRMIKRTKRNRMKKRRRRRRKRIKSRKRRSRSPSMLSSQRKGKNM